MVRHRIGWFWWGATLGWLGGIGALPLVWMMSRESLRGRAPGALAIATPQHSLPRSHRQRLEAAFKFGNFIALFLIHWTLLLLAHAWEPLWPQSPGDYERGLVAMGRILQGLHPMLELVLPSALYLTFFQKPAFPKAPMQFARFGLLGLWVLTQLVWLGLPVVVAWRFNQAM